MTSFERKQGKYSHLAVNLTTFWKTDRDDGDLATPIKMILQCRKRLKSGRTNHLSRGLRKQVKLTSRKIRWKYFLKTGCLRADFLFQMFWHVFCFNAVTEVFKDSGKKIDFLDFAPFFMFTGWLHSHKGALQSGGQLPWGRLSFFFVHSFLLLIVFNQTVKLV